MDKTQNNTGIKLFNIKSESEPVIIDNDLSAEKYGFTNDSFFAAYLFNEVKIGRISELDFSALKDKIIKLRVFSKDRELLLWNEEGILKGRLRIDGKGNDTDCAEIPQVVYGTEYKNGVLREDRGAEVALSFPDGLEKVNERRRLMIITRNYIEYINGYQASYCDNRLVEFQLSEVNKPEGK